MKRLKAEGTICLLLLSLLLFFQPSKAEQSVFPINNWINRKDGDRYLKYQPVNQHPATSLEQ
jgi:hypothetical protein